MENQTTVLDDHLSGDLPDNTSYASKSQRFANYFIDVIILYSFLGAAIFILADVGALNRLEGLDGAFNILFYIGFIIYYFLVESIFKGRTIGKFITKTKVVDENGQTPSTKAIFIRSISRIVPFEAFSAFNSEAHMWHDKWSKTRVVKVNG